MANTRRLQPRKEAALVSVPQAALPRGGNACRGRSLEGRRNVANELRGPPVRNGGGKAEQVLWGEARASMPSPRSSSRRAAYRAARAPSSGPGQSGGTPSNSAARKGPAMRVRRASLSKMLPWASYMVCSSIWSPSKYANMPSALPLSRTFGARTPCVGPCSAIQTATSSAARSLVRHRPWTRASYPGRSEGGRSRRTAPCRDRDVTSPQTSSDRYKRCLGLYWYVEARIGCPCRLRLRIMVGMTGCPS